MFAGFFIINLFVWGYGSSAAIPFTSMLAVMALWFGISVPLTFVGAFIGYGKDSYEHPTRVNPLPRQIPEAAWYMSSLAGIFIGGILPFGTVSIELYFIMTSIWFGKCWSSKKKIQQRFRSLVLQDSFLLFFFSSFLSFLLFFRSFFLLLLSSATTKLHMYRYYVLLRLWFSSCCWSLTICDLGRDVHYVNLLSIMCRRLSLVVAFLFHISVRDSLLLFYILYFFSFPFHNKDDFDGTRLTSSSKLFFFFSDPLRFIHFYTLVIFLSRKVKWITSGASSFVFLSLSLSLPHQLSYTSTTCFSAWCTLSFQKNSWNQFCRGLLWL